MSSNHVVPEVVRAGPEFVVGLSPKQRSVLGIPAVGDRYWNAETVGLLAGRYPGIDTAPYAATGPRLQVGMGRESDPVVAPPHRSGVLGLRIAFGDAITSCIILR